MAAATWREIFERVRDILELVVVDASTNPDTFLKVFPTVPRTIDSPDLPCALVIPGASSRQRSSANAVTELSRTISIYVYLANAKEGSAGQTEAVALNFDIWDKIFEQFDGRPNLQISGSPLVTKAEMTGDGGLTVLVYPFNANAQNAKEFFGVVFQLTVYRSTKTEMKLYG